MALPLLLLCISHRPLTAWLFVNSFLLSAQFSINATKITKFTQSLWPPQTISPAQFSLSPIISLFRSASITSLDVKETINRNCVVGWSICDKLNCAAHSVQQSTWQKKKRNPPAPNIQFVIRPYKIESGRRRGIDTHLRAFGTYSQRRRQKRHVWKKHNTLSPALSPPCATN